MFRVSMSPANLALPLVLAIALPAHAGEDEDINMGMTYMMARQQQAADLAARLAGTWTVQIDPAGQGASCEVATSKVSYTWSVAASDSDLVVSQPADTTFPTVTGYVVSDDALRGEVSPSATGWSILLSGVQRVPGDGGRASAIWLQLRLGADGKLVGTRRYLGWQVVALPGGGSAVVPCFSDFRFVGTR